MKLLFIVFAFIFIGCTTNIKFIEDPQGNIVYQLPESRDAEDHCASVRGFSMETAMGRSFNVYKNDKEKVVIKNKFEDAQADLAAKLRHSDNFTPRGKRNYDKMFSLTEQIYIRKDLVDKTPDQVGDIIYTECMEKMANKTWFND